MGLISWLLSVVLERIPDLWLVPAIGALALYGYGVVEPGRIKAALVNLVSIGLACLAAGLMVYGIATAAYAARVKAAVEAERARIAAIVDQSITDARTEAKAATDAREAAEARLAEALSAMPPDIAPDTNKPKGGGLSPASAGALLKIIGEK